MEPTQAETALIVDLASLLTWSNVSADTPAPPTPPGGDEAAPPPPVSEQTALLRHLRFGSATHFRVLAMFPTDAFAAQLATLTINGAALTPAQEVTMKLAHITARRLCSLEMWPREARRQLQQR